MDAYISPQLDLPNFLYRIHYEGSPTTFFSLDGISAADTTTIFRRSEIEVFKRAVENQFTWSFHGALPFISLFLDLEHARSWGLREPWRGNTGSHVNWSLETIDTSKMPSTACFFKLSHLVEELELNIPTRASQHVKGAFMCLHRIPMTAIVDSRTPREVREGKSPTESVYPFVPNR
jgi:hypothetical protein